MATLANLGVVIDPTGAQQGGQTVLQILTQMAAAADKMAAAAVSMEKSIADGSNRAGTALGTVVPAAGKVAVAIDKIGDVAAQALAKETSTAAKTGADSLAAVTQQAARTADMMQSLSHTSEQTEGVWNQIAANQWAQEVAGRIVTITDSSMAMNAQTERAVSLQAELASATANFDRTLDAQIAAEEHLAAVRANASASAEERTAAEHAFAQAIRESDAAEEKLRVTEAASAGRAAVASAPVQPKPTGPRPTSGLASDPAAFMRQAATQTSAEKEVASAEKAAAGYRATADAARAAGAVEAEAARAAATASTQASKEATEAAKAGEVEKAAAASQSAATAQEAARTALAAAKEYANTAKQAYKDAAEAAKAAGTDAAASEREAARDAADAAKASVGQSGQAYKEASDAAKQAANEAGGAQKQAAKEAAAAVKAAAQERAAAERDSAKAAADAAKQQEQADQRAAKAAADNTAAIQRKRDELRQDAAAAAKDAAEHGNLANSLQRSANVLYLFAQAAGPLSGVVNDVATAFNLTGMVLEKFGGSASSQAEKVKLLKDANAQLKSDQAGLAAAQKAAAEASDAAKAAQGGAATSAKDLAAADENAAKAAKEVEAAEKAVAESAKTAELATKGVGTAMGALVASAFAVVAVLALPIFAIFMLGAKAATTAWGIFTDSIQKGIAFNAIHARFSQFVGDAKTAGDALEQLEELGAKSGLGMPELEMATQRMLNFGAGMREAMEETRNFALIGAATGKDSVSQLANVYVTARDQGEVTMMQIRQLRNSGIDLMADLSKQTGLTGHQLRHLLSEGSIGFDVFKRAIDSATASGGKFDKAFQIRLGTPQGQLDQISAHYDTLLEHLSKPIVPALVPALEQVDKFIQSLNPYADKLGNKLRDLLLVITGAAAEGELGTLINQSLTSGFGKAYEWIKANFLDPIKGYFDKFTEGANLKSSFETVLGNIGSWLSKIFKDGATIVGANISYAFDQALEQLSSVMGFGNLHDPARHNRSPEDRAADALRTHNEDFQNDVGARNLAFTQDVHKAGIALKETTGIMGAFGVTLDIINKRVAGVPIEKYIPTGRAVPKDSPEFNPQPTTPPDPSRRPATAADLEAIASRRPATNFPLLSGDPMSLLMGFGGGFPGQAGRYATPSPFGSPSLSATRSAFPNNFPANGQPGQSGGAGNLPFGAGFGNGQGPRSSNIVVINSALNGAGLPSSLTAGAPDVAALLAGQPGTAKPAGGGTTPLLNASGTPTQVALDPVTMAALQQSGGIHLVGSDQPLTAQQMESILRGGIIVKPRAGEEFQTAALDPLLNVGANPFSLTPSPSSFSLSAPYQASLGARSTAPRSTSTSLLGSATHDEFGLPDLPAGSMTVTPTGPANGLFPSGGYSGLDNAARRSLARDPAAMRLLAANGTPGLADIPATPPVSPADPANTAAVQANTAAIQANSKSLTGVSSEFGYLYDKNGVGRVDKTDENRANWDGEAHYGSPALGHLNIADPSLMGVAISKAQAMEISGMDTWEKAMAALKGVALTVTNTSNGMKAQVVAADVGPGVNPAGKPQVEVTGAVNRELHNLGASAPLTLSLAPGATLNVNGGKADGDWDRWKKKGESLQPDAMPHGAATEGTDWAKAMGNTPTDFKAIMQFVDTVKQMDAALQGGNMSIEEFNRRMNELRSKTVAGLTNPGGSVKGADGSQQSFQSILAGGNQLFSFKGTPAQANQYQQMVIQHRLAMQRIEQDQKQTEDLMRTNDAGYVNSFIEGMQKAITSYGSLQQTIGKIGATVTTGLSSGIAGALQSIATGAQTASQAFRQMASSILADIAKMIIEFAVLALIKQIAGVAGGAIGGSVGSSVTNASGGAQYAGNAGSFAVPTATAVHHTGGIVGEAMTMRMVMPETFTGATRYHTGGVAGLSAGETPIIAQTGEGIFTQAQMAALAPAGGSNQTNNNSVANQYHSEIHIHSDGNTSTQQGQGNSEDAKQAGEALDAKIKSVIIDETTRQGGSIHGYLNGSARNT